MGPWTTASSEQCCSSCRSRYISPSKCATSGSKAAGGATGTAAAACPPTSELSPHLAAHTYTHTLHTRYYVRRCAKPKQRAAIALAVRVGSVVEEEGERGVAHILEHLAFNATEVGWRTRVGTGS